MMPSKPPLADEADRNRFTKELDRNFSVTAPAGVGKTTSIVSRVVELAKTDKNRDEPALPRLIVVTYTRKAADEMRRRTADKLHADKAGPEIFARFNQAFFGTIHSFCLELLRLFGPLAGLAPQFKQVLDLDNLWREYQRSSDNLLKSLPPVAQRGFARHASVSKLYGLIKEFGPQLPAPPPPGPIPEIDLSELFAFQPSKRNTDNVNTGKQLATEWLKTYQADAPCPLPEYTKGGKDFLEVWARAWLPMKLWLGDAYLYLAAQLAEEFRAFRVSRAEINYDDMIALAARLMEHPAVGPAIREEKRIVILDEAQDTDRLQFGVLLNVAGAEWNPNTPLKDAIGPAPGRFCQVGDPQQAIYSSRAELATYREIHEALVESNAADALSYTVTMRCDEEIVEAVNQFYPNILRREDEPGDQAAFVPLTARPAAGPGKVDRLNLPADPIFDAVEKPKTEDRVDAEVRNLARWMRETGCEAIGATDWSEVALLAPRKLWLEAMANALERENLPVQNHSIGGSRANDPITAWTTAIIRVLAYPEDAFELSGVLREIFALPDDQIAHYIEARKSESTGGIHALSLCGDIHGDSAIEKALDAIHQLRKDVQCMALGDTCRTIIERLSLTDRFSALPELDPTQIHIGLKRLMANALAAEELGQDFQAWADTRIRSLGDEQEGEDPKPGHIQLLTCHKAKGLQWQVVMVPMSHRDIQFKNKNFPRYYPARAGEPAIVAYDKESGKNLGSRYNALQAQETQRLAYVTWTRAQRRLILVDDSAYYAKAKISESWIAHWNVIKSGPNAQAWANLAAFESTSPSPAADSTPDGDLSDSPEQPRYFRLYERVSQAIRQLPQTFPERILPSSLANHATQPEDTANAFTGHARDEHDWRSEPGYPETQSGAEALGGADYGNWWHDAMEHGPWSHPPETWRRHFDAIMPQCPIPKRGQKELDALLATDEFTWLNDEARRVRTEPALLWPEGATAPDQPEFQLQDSTGLPTSRFAYDGFIDLLAHDADRDRWRVVDWKTDRFEANPATELLKAYGPQLTAYVQALRTMFGRPVEGYLYSTRAAKWIRLPS